MLNFSTTEGIFNFRVAGTVLHEGKVLVHQFPNQKHWILPGGRCEFGEDTAATVIREFEEEIGLTLKLEKLIAVIEVFFYYSEDHFHELDFVYLLSGLTPEQFPNGIYDTDDGKLVFEWVALEDLKERKFFPACLIDLIQNPQEEVAHFIERTA